jgi:hypothetical protein
VTFSTCQTVLSSVVQLSRELYHSTNLVTRAGTYQILRTAFQIVCQIPVIEEEAIMQSRQPTVAYMYDEGVGDFCYGGGNPMRPHRVRLTHSLVNSYGLSSKMMQCNPEWQSQDEISQFHADGTNHLPITIAQMQHIQIVLHR